MTLYDAIVVGGGPAGAMAALHLARAGADIVVLERTHATHHKVCGEFINAGAVRHLAKAGIDLAGQPAEKITHCRLVCGQEIANQPLPENGLSLSRFALDEMLLRQARKEGAVIRRGYMVKALTAEPPYWRVESTDGFCARAPAAFLASGKHNLRGWPRPAGSYDPIAFKLHYRLAPEQAAALAGHVEIHIFDGGYAGIEPVESGHANLCLVVSRRCYKMHGKTWPRFTGYLRAACPHLDRRLTGASPCWPQPLAISSISYGYVYKPAPAEPPGLYRLGDQMAVTPSFSGSGMAIALHTAGLASHHYLNGDALTYYDRARKDIAPTIKKAVMLSRIPHKYVHGICLLFPGLAAKLVPAVSFQTPQPL